MRACGTTSPRSSWRASASTRPRPRRAARSSWPPRTPSHGPTWAARWARRATRRRRARPSPRRSRATRPWAMRATGSRSRSPVPASGRRPWGTTATPLPRCPQWAEPRIGIGNALAKLGRRREAVEALAEAARLDASRAREIESQQLFLMQYGDEFPSPDVSAAHIAWGRKHAPSSIARDVTVDPLRRIRVGYVSPRFQVSSMAFALLPVLAAHDRSRFEVYCYAEREALDATGEQFRALADHWRETQDRSDDEAGRDDRRGRRRCPRGPRGPHARQPPRGFRAPPRARGGELARLLQHDRCRSHRGARRRRRGTRNAALPAVRRGAGFRGAGALSVPGAGVCARGHGAARARHVRLVRAPCQDHREGVRRVERHPHARRRRAPGPEERHAR